MRIILSIAIASFLLRLLIIGEFTQTPYYLFTLNMNGPDQNFFAKWGENIYVGNWHGVQNPIGKPFYVAPLYSWLISISMHYNNQPLFGVHLLQAILSSCMVIIFYKIGLILSKPKAGILSAIIWSLYGPSYFYDSCLIRASLAASISAFLLFGCLQTLHHKHYLKYSVATGITLGIHSLLRPSLFFIIIPLIFCLGGIIKKNKKILFSGLIIIGCAWITISPATYNNWAQSNTFVPISSQGADSIILGNDLNGPGVGFHPTQSSASWKQSSQNSLPVVLRQIQSNTIREPRLAAGLYLRKFKMLWNDYEVGANYSYYLYKKIVGLSAIPFLTFGWLFAFAIIGLFAPSENKLVHWIKIFFIVSFLQALLIHIQSRYRFPGLPSMILLSALGVQYTWNCIVKFKYAHIFSLFVIIVTLSIYTIPYPSYGVRYATNPDKIRSLMSEPISMSDCTTIILAYLMYGTEIHKQDITYFSTYAFKHYGLEFMAEFHKVSNRLLSSISDQRRREMLSNKLSKMGAA